LSILFTCVCHGQAPRDIAQAAFKSVVILEMNDSNGQPTGFGSGFFISNSIVATNAHVIKGAFSGAARLVGDSHKMQILGVLEVDYHNDLALLKVSSDAPPLHLGADANPIVGDKVYVVGNPLGLEGTFSEGIVSGLRNIENESIVQMTAPISPGSSGGPVMDATGNVIGIAEATYSEGQNLNLAVPVAYLSKLLATSKRNTTVMSLAQAAKQNPTNKSLVDGIASRTDSGVVTTNFKMVYSNPNDKLAGYEFRLSNTLPVAIADVRVRIIYYDAAKSVMDFDDVVCKQVIRAGLTRTITRDDSVEAGRAVHYYRAHSYTGQPLSEPSAENTYNAYAMTMKPYVELRVISFRTEDSEY
jgi:hypothetical protein